ncbi:MAG: secretin N-terminal domain-containing protein [Opitutaceae bacterium]|jgi:type IV pilus assembly protein PilQ
MRTRLVLLASVAVVSQIVAQDAPAPAVPVVSQPEAAVAAPVAPVPEATSVPVVAPDPVAVGAVVTAKAKDTLSVDFPDEEIRTILRNVADLFELNLVIPDTLQGRTSLKLREVTWRQIFQVVLSPVGYTFVEDGNIIKIVSQDSLAAEPVSTEIFLINYAKAGDIIKTITTLVDPAAGGKIIVDDRSNSLVITERPSRMQRIRPIIEKLDHATEQVAIEAKFIDIIGKGDKELGIDWALGAQASAQIANHEQSGNNPAILPTITETSLLPSATLVGKSNVATSVLSAAQLSAALNFIENSSNSRVVSNPTVVTLNNTEATINVGTEYPIPSYNYNSQTGSFEVSGFEYKPIGVLLKVTPQINSQGFIKLTVEPEISSFSKTDVVSFGQGSSIPIISTKKTKTQVSLRDGYTLGIGGLITDTNGTTDSRLPFFGSIPGIGRLFRNETKSTERKNLLVFITAKIVSAETAPIEDIFDPRVIREAGLKRSDVSGYREKIDPFLPEDAPSVPQPKKGK